MKTEVFPWLDLCIYFGHTWKCSSYSWLFIHWTWVGCIQSKCIIIIIIVIIIICKACCIIIPATLFQGFKLEAKNSWCCICSLCMVGWCRPLSHMIPCPVKSWVPRSFPVPKRFLVPFSEPWFLYTWEHGQKGPVQLSDLSLVIML